MELHCLLCNTTENDISVQLVVTCDTHRLWECELKSYIRPFRNDEALDGLLAMH